MVVNPFAKVAEIRHPKASEGVLPISPTRARVEDNGGKATDAFDAFAPGADP